MLRNLINLIFGNPKVYQKEWDREYFELYKDCEVVPCIVSGELIKRHHAVITRNGFVSLEAYKKGQHDK